MFRTILRMCHHSPTFAATASRAPSEARDDCSRSCDMTNPDAKSPSPSTGRDETGDLKATGMCHGMNALTLMLYE